MTVYVYSHILRKRELARSSHPGGGGGVAAGWLILPPRVAEGWLMGGCSSPPTPHVRI